MDQELIKNLSVIYRKVFGISGKETFVFSPGRINLLGEHVDYNDGVMLPAAIDLGIYLMGERRKDRMVHLYSAEYKESVTLDLSGPIVKSGIGWANYIIGVVAQLQKKHIEVPGFNLVFNGDIPIGAGLSSSAALECGVALFVNHIANAALSRVEMALLAQKAEHEYAGVFCGIMDQMASILGKEGMVIQLDSKTLNYKYVRLDLKNYALVLIDSRVKHSLASSEYNVRRRQCQEALDVLKARYQVQSFRDCTIKMLNESRENMDTVIFRRGKYVLEEMERVSQAVEAIRLGNIDVLGEWMSRTHQGLSRDYEVSCKELDFLQGRAMKYKEVIGSRMMGGGFGGCTLNLVEIDAMDAVTKEISESFQKEYKIIPHIIPVNLSAGTTIINIKEQI